MAVFTDSIFFHVIVVILTICMLWKGADWLVDAACKLANLFGVSPLIIGLTIVAVGTSAPEFAVSISAALDGNPEIALGNVFGSNIFNLGFILGLGALFSNLKTTPITVYRDGTFLLFTVILLYFFMFGATFKIFLGGYLSPIEALVLIFFLIAYICYLYFGKTEVEDVPEEKFRKVDAFWLLLGLTLVVTGGYYLVESAVKIGEYIGLSTWIIGITIIAAGTSSPELATTIVSIVKKKYDIAIGNLIGSDLFNMLGVIGIAAIVGNGIKVPDIAHLSLLLLAVNLLIILLFVRTSWKLVRWEGVFLIAIALGRYYLEFFVF